MVYEIIIDSRVTDDFGRAFEYYNNISETLGSNFHASFLDALHRLLRHPENYFNISKRFRSTCLKRYPYMLVYQVKEGRVEVRALFHQSRKTFVLKK